MNAVNHLSKKYQSVSLEELPNLPVSALVAFADVDPELFAHLFGVETIGDLANNEILLIAHQLVSGDVTDYDALGGIAEGLPEELFSVPPAELPHLPISVFSEIVDTYTLEAHLGITTLSQLAELLTPVHQLFEAARESGKEEDGLAPVIEPEVELVEEVEEEKKKSENRPMLRHLHNLEALLNDQGEFDYEARNLAAQQATTMREEAAAASRSSPAGAVGSAGVGTGGATGKTSLPKGTTAGLHHDNSGWTSLGPHNVGGRTLAILPVYQQVGEGDAREVGEEDARPAGKVIYVNQANTTSGTGDSWTAAYTDLQVALKAANKGDEIWVAAGTYKPTTDGNREISFELKDGVKIYGGFSGKEDDRLLRDWLVNKTILSGNIDNAEDKSANSFHVVTGTALSEDTVLDGFTITDGNADAQSGLRFSGGFRNEFGGGLNLMDCSPTLSNLTFTDNSASRDGGAIYIFASKGIGNLKLINVNFFGNESGSSGGALSIIAINGEYQLNLTNAKFFHNSCKGNGGAISIDNDTSIKCTASLSNISFWRNNASYGGAMEIDCSGPLDVALKNASFSGNYCTSGGGGAVFMKIGQVKSIINATMFNVKFSGNKGKLGGAFYIFDFMGNGHSKIVLTKVTFSGNYSESVGGAIYHQAVREESTLELVNAIFWENKALFSGNQIEGVKGKITVSNSIVQGGIGSTKIQGSDVQDVDPLFLKPVRPLNAPTTSGDLSLRDGSPAIDFNQSGVTIGANPKPKKLVFYAGAASGGVWYSDDEGANWVPTEDLMPNLAVGALAADPRDPTGQTLYAGTGEGALTPKTSRFGHPLGAGIFRSTDGWSWAQIKETKPTKDNKAFTGVNKLVFSKDGDMLVAATNGGIWYAHRSTNFTKWTQAKYAINPNRLMAENGDVEGGAKRDNYALGRRGSKYVVVNPGSLTFHPYVLADGEYDIKIRYATGQSKYAESNCQEAEEIGVVGTGISGGSEGRAKPAVRRCANVNVTVNKDPAKIHSFSGTKNIDEWRFKTIRVTLKQGQNDIRFEKKKDPGPNQEEFNIDYIEISNSPQPEAKGSPVDNAATKPSAPSESSGKGEVETSTMSKPAGKLVAAPMGSLAAQENGDILVAGHLIKGTVYLSRDGGETWQELKQSVHSARLQAESATQITGDEERPPTPVRDPNSNIQYVSLPSLGQASASLTYNAGEAGAYDLEINCWGNAKPTSCFSVKVNSGNLQVLNLNKSAIGNVDWQTQKKRVNLTEGNNVIEILNESGNFTFTLAYIKISKVLGRDKEISENGEKVELSATVGTQGTYKLRMWYAISGNPGNDRTINLTVNSGTPGSINLPESGSFVEKDVLLNTGANKIALQGASGETGNIKLSAIDLVSPVSPASSYDLSSNGARRYDDGNGKQNIELANSTSRLNFTSDEIPAAASYDMTIRYSTVADSASGSNEDCTVWISANGDKPKVLTIGKTASAQDWQTASTSVNLNAGSNTIEIWRGPGQNTINIDYIELQRPEASGRVEVCFARADPNLVYVLAELKYKSVSGYLMSLNSDNPSNDNLNFKGMVTGIFGANGQGWVDICLWAGDPNDKNLIVAGGVDLHRSEDGGTTFNKIGGYEDTRAGQTDKLHRYPHPDQHFIVEDPRYGENSKRVWIGNDGGIFTTKDITKVYHHAKNEATPSADKALWEVRNHGYSVTQFYYGTGNPQNRIVIAGAQDNGTRSHTPGNYDWDVNKVRGGDGSAVAFDPTDANRFYASEQNLNVFRINKTGGNGNPVTWKSTRIKPDFQCEKPAFIAPFTLDPNNNKVLYAGAASLWRSSDATAAPADLKWYKLQPAVGDKTAKGKVSAIAVGSTVDIPEGGLSNLILVGYYKGEIWRTKNANISNENLPTQKPTWEEVGPLKDKKPLPNRKSLCIAIDPKESSIIYAGFGGFQDENLWKSVDCGDNWTDISGNLPQVPVHSITVHPEDSNWLYAGTDIGLFASEDGGVTWAVANEGPASVAVTDMFWMGTTLVAVTFGRGLFQIDIPIRKNAQKIIYGDTAGTLTLISPSDGTTSGSPMTHAGAKLSPILPIHSTTSLSDVVGKALGNKLANSFFVGDDQGKLYWYGSMDLASKWTNSNKNIEGAIQARPALWLDGEPRADARGGDKDAGDPCVVVADSTGHVYVFDIAADAVNPVLKLKFLQDPSVSAVNVKSISVLDNWAYITSDQGIYAVRLVGDQPGVEWYNDTVVCSTSPLIAANTLFVNQTTSGPVNQQLKAYDLRTGAALWSQNVGQNPCQPVWSLGAVVVGNETNVMGYDHVTGKALFNENAGGKVSAIKADDALLYFVASATGAGDANLCKWALNPAKPSWGTSEVAKVSIASAGKTAPLVVGENIYVADLNGNLYCFGPASSAGSSGLVQKWKTLQSNPPNASLEPVF